MKFKVWLDSGANHSSMRRVITSLEELAITVEEWNSLSEEEQEEIMKEVAFEQAEWGYEEVKDES